MPSPFPGMDPYLQRSWRDVHQRLITYSADQLQRQLPPDLRARIEERVLVQGPEASRDVYPDVWVVQQPAHRVREGSRSSATAEPVAEPVILRHTQEGPPDSFVQIVEAGGGGHVVTTLELLSMSNKIGPGLDEFRRKQAELMSAGVNLVEIDFIRGGGHALSVPRHLLAATPAGSYCACVYRASQPDQFEVYPLPLRESLPAIRVPLREGDEDVYLGLQTLVNLCYENGGYDDTDYSVEPEPPLGAEDAAWADGVLREAGVRH